MESASLAGGTAGWPPVPSWLRVLGCVIAGSVAATFVALVAQLLGDALGLLPGNLDGVPGRGWPWRVDGAWAAVADLGPCLAAGFAFSAAVIFYLGLSTGVRARRWPLALLAAGVGFVSVGSPRAGYVAVSGVLALVLVVLAARHESRQPRRRIDWSPLGLGLVAVVSLGLIGSSLAYGQLHPLVFSVPDRMTSVYLSHGHSKELFTLLDNRAALATRVLGVELVGAPGLGVRALTDAPRAEGPTPAGLRRPLAGMRIAPGAEPRAALLTLAARACAQRGSAARWTVSAVAVRMRVAGAVRTQRFALSPAWQVACRP